MVFTGTQRLGRDERLAVCGVFNFFAGEVSKYYVLLETCSKVSG